MHTIPKVDKVTKIIRLFAYYALPIFLAISIPVLFFLPVSGTDILSYWTYASAWGLWSIFFLLYIKSISVIGSRDLDAQYIRIDGIFHRFRSLKKLEKHAILIFLRDLLFSVSSYSMLYRRELWVASFYLILNHGILSWVGWVKNGEGLLMNASELYIVFWLIGLLALFIGWLTSNDTSVRFFKWHWKTIQYSSYIAITLGTLHVLLLGAYQYGVMLLAFYVLKYFEWYPSGKIPNKAVALNSNVLLTLLDAEWVDIQTCSPRMNETILESIERSWATIPSSCRSGICRQCVCRIEFGKEMINASMRGRANVDLNDNEILTCISWIHKFTYASKEEHRIILQEWPAEPVFETTATVERLEYSPSKEVVCISCKVKDLFSFREWQFMNIEALVDGVDILRSYSIASTNIELQEKWHIWFCIKKVEWGILSNFATKQLKVWDTIKIQWPFGRMTNTRIADNYVLISVWSGLSPILAIYKALVQNGKYKKIVHIYGERTIDEVIPEVHHMMNTLKNNISHTLYLSREENPMYSHGYVQNGLKKAIDSLGIEDISCFICGRPDMVDDVIKKLMEFWIPSENILSEKY